MVYMLHRSRDINTFTVYVNACDLEKSVFDVKIEITGRVRFRLRLCVKYISLLVFAVFLEVWELKRFHTAKVTIHDCEFVFLYFIPFPRYLSVISKKN